MVQRTKGIYIPFTFSTKPAISPATSLERLLTYLDQVNIEHQMLGREGNVVEGEEHDSGDSSAGSITKEIRILHDQKAADLA